MKRFGRARLTDEISSLPGQVVQALRAAALTLLLLGVSVGVSAAEKTAPPTAPKPQNHVYLLRGAFNIFSLGMDEIASRVERMGVATTVTNYLGWESLADEAAAAYKSGRIKNIILVGHSSGATAVTEMAARLGQLGVPVKLAIGLDPTTHMIVSGNVARYVNYYVAGGMGTSVDKGKQFTGNLSNVDLERNRDIGHFNIDKSRAVQDLVIRDIRAAL
jgi:pimeloyl-ACP methyl ester carboxylesterase